MPPFCLRNSNDVWRLSISGTHPAVENGGSQIRTIRLGRPHETSWEIFNSTAVGLERRAGTLRHLPLGLDELQVLNERRLSASWWFIPWATATAKLVERKPEDCRKSRCGEMPSSARANSRLPRGHHGRRTQPCLGTVRSADRRCRFWEQGASGKRKPLWFRGESVSRTHRRHGFE